MVRDADTIEVILPKFLEFCKDSVLVAHNAKFDTSFIKHFAKAQDILEKVPKYTMDTLEIARELYPSFENHKLGTLAQNLDVELIDAHRAINDTRATVKVCLKMLEYAKERGVNPDGYVHLTSIDDAKKLNAPHGFEFNIRNVELKAGAGFVVVLAGKIMTMPGLPKVPAAENIDIDDNGEIVGIF